MIDLDLFSGSGGVPPMSPNARLQDHIFSLYEHMQSGDIEDAETALLGAIAAWPDSIQLANMLPGILATAVPKILGYGSSHFTYADGHKLAFGGVYSPPEYTMLYLELVMHKNLLGHPPIPMGSAVHRTLYIMWDILLELIPAARRAEAIRRYDSYAPLPDNVVRFRRKH